MPTPVEPLIEDIMLADIHARLIGLVAILSGTGRERLRRILQDAQQACWDIQHRTRY